MFYKVLHAFWINCRELQTVEMFSIVVPFAKPYVLQCFPKVPSMGSGSNSYRLHLMPEGLEF